MKTLIAPQVCKLGSDIDPAVLVDNANALLRDATNDTPTHTMGMFQRMNGGVIIIFNPDAFTPLFGLFRIMGRFNKIHQF